MSTVTISPPTTFPRATSPRTTSPRSAAISGSGTAGSGTAGSGTAGVRAAAAARRRSPVRLTRRGRLVLTAVLLAAFLAGGVLMAGGLASAGTEPGAAATATRVTVQPGQTLWSIAERAAPGTDPRDTVEDILRLNHLDSVAVEAGSVLLLP